jgi:hypothetical protein
MQKRVNLYDAESLEYKYQVLECEA